MISEIMTEPIKQLMLGNFTLEFKRREMCCSRSSTSINITSRAGQITVITVHNYGPCFLTIFNSFKKHRQ